jgi:hypothetical protein
MPRWWALAVLPFWVLGVYWGAWVLMAAIGGPEGDTTFTWLGVLAVIPVAYSVPVVVLALLVRGWGLRTEGEHPWIPAAVRWMGTITGIVLVVSVYGLTLAYAEPDGWPMTPIGLLVLLLGVGGSGLPIRWLWVR